MCSTIFCFVTIEKIEYKIIEWSSFNYFHQYRALQHSYQALTGTIVSRSWEVNHKRRLRRLIGVHLHISVKLLCSICYAWWLVAYLSLIGCHKSDTLFTEFRRPRPCIFGKKFSAEIFLGCPWGLLGLVFTKRTYFHRWLDIFRRLSSSLYLWKLHPVWCKLGEELCSAEIIFYRKLFSIRVSHGIFVW